jgi:hypothetical protein
MKKFLIPICLITGISLGYAIASLRVSNPTANATTQPVDATNHKAKDLVFHCADFRFKPMEGLFVCSTCSEKKADVLSWAGGVKIINSDNPVLVEEALKNIGKLIETHGVENIRLMNHLDCAGYGGSAKHESPAAEHEFHKKELNRAAGIVQQKFPNVHIYKYIETFHEIKPLVP